MEYMGHLKFDRHLSEVKEISRNLVKNLAITYIFCYFKYLEFLKS